MRIVAIAGPRSFADQSYIWGVLEEIFLGDANAVVSGGAKGVDTVAMRYVKEWLEWRTERVIDGTGWAGTAMRRLRQTGVEILPNYKMYLSKSAPFRRNETIAEVCTELHVIVGPAWSGEGGSKHVLDYARGIGRETYLHECGTE